MGNEEKTCPSCGQKLPKETKFCGHCGTDVTMVDAEATPVNIQSKLNVEGLKELKKAIPMEKIKSDGDFFGNRILNPVTITAVILAFSTFLPWFSLGYEYLGWRGADAQNLFGRTVGKIIFLVAVAAIVFFVMKKTKALLVAGAASAVLGIYQMFLVVKVIFSAERVNNTSLFGVLEFTNEVHIRIGAWVTLIAGIALAVACLLYWGSLSSEEQ